MTAQQPPLLSVNNLTMKFGGLTALNDVTFAVLPQTVTAVIGPNGAGKTTFFNCLSGFYRPTSGAIHLDRDGQIFDVAALPSHKIAAKIGVVRTFQNLRLFKELSVLENLIMAQHRNLTRLMGWKLWRTDVRRDALAEAEQWLEFFGLQAYANRPAGDLPYGIQRRTEIARALCVRPRLLCLDEPAAGLNPQESAELANKIRQLRDMHDVTILLIEHDMSVVMNISDHVVVLDYGRLLAQGTPAQIRANPDVIKAYLGQEASHA